MKKINLLSQEEVIRAFGPLIGHFSPRAKLIFDGCNLIDVGSHEQKKEIMSQILKNFQIRSGSLYLNETLGMGSSTTKVIARRLKGESLADIAGDMIDFSLPAMAILGYPLELFSNRGYTLKVDGSGEKLFRDRMGNALESSETVEEKAPPNWSYVKAGVPPNAHR